MSEILNKLFKTYRVEDADTISFVFIDKETNVVVEKINAHLDLYETFKKVEEGKLNIVLLENKSDAEIGFVYTPDEGE